MTVVWGNLYALSRKPPISRENAPLPELSTISTMCIMRFESCELIARKVLLGNRPTLARPSATHPLALRRFYHEN